MPTEKHTDTYNKASREFGDAAAEAQRIEKRAVALKIIANNLLSKAEDETLIDKLKHRLKGG
jgi:hypothetical protein